MTDDKSGEQHGACLPTAAGRGRLRAYEGGYIRGLSFCASLRLLRIASRSQHAAICHLSSVICHLSFASPLVIGYWLFAKRGYYVLLGDLNMPPSVICHLSSVIRFALGYRPFAICSSRTAAI